MISNNNNICLFQAIPFTTPNKGIALNPDKSKNFAKIRQPPMVKNGGLIISRGAALNMNMNMNDS